MNDLRLALQLTFWRSLKFRCSLEKGDDALIADTMQPIYDQAKLEGGEYNETLLVLK